MLLISFSLKAFLKALKPNYTRVFSVNIRLLNKSHGIKPY
jgi:hypothetical protein